MRLGAETDGQAARDRAMTNFVGNLPGKTFFEPAALQTTMLYAGANRRTTHRMAELDIPEASSMRAPGEAVGHAGAGMRDGRAGRKARHRPDRAADPQRAGAEPGGRHAVFRRKLVDCMQEGAKLFGWDKRNKTRPGSRRALAGRHGHCRRDARQPAAALQGRSATQAGWHGYGAARR